MIVAGFADIHGDLQAVDRTLEQLGSADLVLLLGDITQFGRQEDVRRVIDRITPHGPRVLAVAGNCDRPEVETFLSDAGINLHARGVVMDGIGFVGLGRSLPCPYHTVNEASDRDLKRWLEEAVSSIPPGTPLVLATHQPPFETVADLAFTREHVGSRAVRDFIEAHRPLVCFTGHIHEGAGLDTIGATRIINPGPLRAGGYAYAEFGRGIEALEIRGFRS